MGFFDKVERRIEGLVSNAFARTFKGAVQPVEISSRLQRELDSEARLLSRDKRLVPNEFTIGLSQTDYDHLAPYSKTLNQEIIPELRDYAGKRGYVFNGPVRINYELDKSLPTGRFTIASEAVAKVGEANPASETMLARSPLVVEVNGVRHPLVPPGLVIGRGTEADLRINDPGISRRHAQISVAGTGDNQVIEIMDLGSTNGIIVNGQKVSRSELRAGSRIEIGTTRMLVHRPNGE